MPTYQYVCKACQERLEAVQAFSDPALTECPSCGGRLRKVFSSVGIVFKGSGFYRTDSREAAEAAANGSDGAAKESKDMKTPETTSSDGKSATVEKSSDKVTSKPSNGSSSKTPAAAAASH